MKKSGSGVMFNYIVDLSYLVAKVFQFADNAISICFWRCTFQYRLVWASVFLQLVRIEVRVLLFQG